MGIGWLIVIRYKLNPVREHISVGIRLENAFDALVQATEIKLMPIDALYLSNPFSEMTSMSLPNDNINTTQQWVNEKTPYILRLNHAHTHTPDTLT